MALNTSISLEAKPRTGKGTHDSRRLRRDGLVPITLYGAGDTTSGTVGRRELAAILRSSSGRNSIFTVSLGSEATPVKIADLQLHPVHGQLIHADFMRISLTEKNEFEVPLKIVGEAIGVRQSAGLLDVPTHTLSISCLPGDLPDSIEVDVSHLEIGDHLRVSDLKIDTEKIEMLADPELLIATVVPPRVEEEPVVEAAPEAAAEPELIKKGKTEEEES
jgi:large subunit ribosomal protein L25